MSAELQAMQLDDWLNPGMLWVKDGEALWQRDTGAALVRELPRPGPDLDA